MKLYGYAATSFPSAKIVPMSLAEVTLCATADELRQFSGFITFCAAEMDRMGTTYDHIHLSDEF